MKLDVKPNYDEMCRTAANLIISYVKKKPSALLCFPSGDTPTGIFSYLLDDVNKGNVDFKDCSFVGLDEWVGLNGSHEGSCRHYMDQHLFFPLNIHPDQIHFFDGAALNIENECKRIDAFIRESGRIDLMMVGLGLNGHVGLNEPGVDFQIYSHASPLAQKTKDSAQKYFKEAVLLTDGITLGPRHLQEAEVAVLVASGISKAEIIVKALEEEVSNSIPASIFQNHPNAYVFLDREAATRLSGKTDSNA